MAELVKLQVVTLSLVCPRRACIVNTSLSQMTPDSTPFACPSVSNQRRRSPSPAAHRTEIDDSCLLLFSQTVRPGPAVLGRGRGRGRGRERVSQLIGAPTSARSVAWATHRHTSACFLHAAGCTNARSSPPLEPPSRWTRRVGTTGDRCWPRPSSLLPWTGSPPTRSPQRGRRDTQSPPHYWISGDPPPPHRPHACSPCLTPAPRGTRARHRGCSSTACRGRPTSGLLRAARRAVTGLGAGLDGSGLLHLSEFSGRSASMQQQLATRRPINRQMQERNYRMRMASQRAPSILLRTCRPRISSCSWLVKTPARPPGQSDNRSLVGCLSTHHRFPPSSGELYERESTNQQARRGSPALVRLPWHATRYESREHPQTQSQ